MKRNMGLLLSTISTVAMTVALGMPAAAVGPPANETRPIERLASIRESYLATLPETLPAQASGESGDQVAQFRNFPNFPNFSNWRNQ
jgi:hypothetical protein